MLCCYREKLQFTISNVRVLFSAAAQDVKLENRLFNNEHRRNY